ncbi:hypothetical protein H6F76_22315 [Leptolyngbya sp. FACHB-321]|uniref:hypothetical protein n=1 Tax=Leptolyngbya sp. FACHB-321 TaxID=2692807 RepID=UPI001688258E|nr:hypothetical protein [Leptolyngbya sp. FACHB-321]MBD2037694.1 hypothetical protein [Leptolyngbya sp. FACHB-321]
MKVASLLTGLAMVGLVTVGDVGLNGMHSLSVNSATAAEAKQAGPSVQEKIDLITKNKGQIGGGDQLRRFFYGNLEPIGIQVGGAGHVVNLYNKANDVTFSYCSHYDVVVAVKRGRVAQFPPNEVK